MDIMIMIIVAAVGLTAFAVHKRKMDEAEWILEETRRNYREDMAKASGEIDLLKQSVDLLAQIGIGVEEELIDYFGISREQGINAKDLPEKVQQICRAAVSARENVKALEEANINLQNDYCAAVEESEKLGKACRMLDEEVKRLQASEATARALAKSNEDAVQIYREHLKRRIGVINVACEGVEPDKAEGYNDGLNKVLEIIDEEEE